MRDPFEVDTSADVVQALLAAATAELGSAPPFVSVPYWADSAFIAAAGIPTVLFGASGTGAHAAEEWVSIPGRGGGDADPDRGGAELCG